MTTATAPDSSHAIQRKTTDMVDRIADLNKRCSCAIRSYAQRPRAASDAVERPSGLSPNNRVSLWAVVA